MSIYPYVLLKSFPIELRWVSTYVTNGTNPYHKLKMANRVSTLNMIETTHNTTHHTKVYTHGYFEMSQYI